MTSTTRRPSLTSPIAVLINRVDELTPAMTTVMLIEATTRRGHPVDLIDVADLGLTADSQVVARARRPPAPAPARADPPARTAWLAALKAIPPEPIRLDACRLLLIRTNPARDVARWEIHQTALALTARLARSGIPVVNHPDGLIRAASKLYLAELPPNTFPATLITRDPAAIRAFVAEAGGPAGGPVVLKPVHGTRGRGVFLTHRDDPNLGVIIETLLAGGYVLAQAYVPGAEEGDVRVIVLGGQILEIDGTAAAIRRLPGAGDFRSNLHAGGRAEPARLTPAMRAVAEVVGRILMHDGIFLAGLDLIGDRVIEVNVFSPGGLRDAERFGGVDFCDAVVRSLESRG